MLAKIFLLVVTPKYESVVKIKLADAQFGVSHESMYRDFDVFATNSIIGAEVEMLESQVVIKRALKHLDLGITVYKKSFLRKKELYQDCPLKIIAEPLQKEPMIVPTKWSSRQGILRLNCKDLPKKNSGEN